MIAPVRELWSWVTEHRGLLGLTTAASYAHLHYAKHGLPPKLLILPSLAALVCMVIPLSAAVAHDAKSTLARWCAVLVGLAALVPAVGWGHGYRKEIAIHAPTMLVAPALLCFVALLLIAWRSKVDLREWGMGLGDVGWWSRPVGILLALILVGIPLVALAFPEFVSFYPRYRPARVEPNVVALLQYQIAIGVYMFSWEFLFRGFMLFGVARYTGPAAAIIIQAYPFYLLHDIKPEPELISSWFGGILVGWLCWRAKSMWPSFLLHWVQYSTMEISAFVVRHGLVAS